MCDDRCPTCDTEVTPLISVDLSRRLGREDYEWVSRRLEVPFSLAEAEQTMQVRLTA